MNGKALTDQIVALTQARQFVEVAAIWRRSANAVRESEVAMRMVAAATAQQGDLEGAETILAELVRRPDAAASSFALGGRVAFDLGRFADSVGRWERAVHLHEDNAPWWRWFAEAAIQAMMPDRALRAASVHRLRINQDPELAITFVTLLVGAGRSDEALIEFERILGRWPHHALAGPAFVEFVLREFPLEARELLQQIAWRPEPPVLSAALVRATVRLPAFTDTNEASVWWRRRLVTELQSLTSLAEQSELRGDERAVCLASTPFFAAYCEQDVTAIQFAWGDFVEAIVAPLRVELPKMPHAAGSVRSVGIVSNRVTNSSAGHFFNSWVTDLKTAGFLVRVYALGVGDSVTAEIEQQVLLHRFPNEDVSMWRALSSQLLADNNDVLIFPEPQGSQLIQLIAGIRYAPTQCAAFGNPVTTGLHTMDYFLTPDDAEVPDTPRFYREKVVRLSGQGTSITAPPQVAAYSRESFGFLPGETIYLVSQQLQKWTPDFIAALAQILARDPTGRLVYFALNWGLSTRAFEKLLRAEFARAGIAYGTRVSVVGQLARENYLALHRGADVALDTFGFSGGSSTFDALAVGLPVVTLEGEFLRGRQSASMVRRAGFAANVVKDCPAFVQRALDVAAARVVERRNGGEAQLPAANKPKLAVSGSSEAIFENVAQWLRSIR